METPNHIRNEKKRLTVLANPKKLPERCERPRSTKKLTAVTRKSALNVFYVNCGNWSLCARHGATAMIRQYRMQLRKSDVYSPGLRVYVSHHCVKCSGPLLQNVTERMKVTLVYVKECVGGKLHRLMGPRTPFIQRGIKLMFWVSTRISNNSCHSPL
jgi:hypothetical protein